MAENNKKHVKQIGLKCFDDDLKRIQKIQAREDFKFESDAIRYALEVEEENTKLHEILISHKNEIKRYADKIEGMEWRSNAMHDQLMLMTKLLQEFMTKNKGV